MWLLNLSWCIKLMLIFVTVEMAQEDTLKSALNAVHRRQQDLTEIPDSYSNNWPGRFYYLPSDKDDLAFLKSKEILEEETQWIKGSCTKIQRACNEVADVLGNYGLTLEAACNMYQTTCLLCGENTWFPPTRHCNVLCIEKSDELCDDDKNCQKFVP